MEYNEIFDAYQFHTNRMLIPGEDVVKCNIFVLDIGKIWSGDINIIKDGDILENISNDLGKKLYLTPFGFDIHELIPEHIIMNSIKII